MGGVFRLAVDAIEKVSLKGLSGATIILFPTVKVIKRRQRIAKVLYKDARYIKGRNNEANPMLKCVS